MSRRALCLLHIYDLYQGGKDHMKKNVKYLGMTAAALLAVAPVAVSATSGVASADTTAATTAPIQIEAKPNTQSVETTTNVNTINIPNLALTAGNVVSGSSKILNVVNSAGTPVTSLEAGQTYTIRAVVAVNGLKPGQQYKFTEYNNGVYTDRTVTASADGYVGGVYVTAKVTAYNSAEVGQPYFTNAANGQVIGNGDYVNAIGAWSNTVAGIKDNAERLVVARYNDANGTAHALNVTTTTSEIASQLSNQGVSVNNGVISSNATSFYVTLTTVNPVNNKTATVKVQFKKNQNNNAYPLIQYNYNGQWNNVQQGSDSLGQVGGIRLTAGSTAARAFRAGNNFRAFATVVNSGQLSLQVVTNTVNPEVPGVYKVTLRATNPNGLSTDFTYNVMIEPAAPSENTTATVHFANGYSVNLWNVLSNNSVAFTGSHIPAGSTVTTHETKTVNGVSYTRITTNKFTGNGYWIQTQYLSDAWKDGQSSNTNTSTSSSKEEAFNGVVVVRYNGKGSVALVDSEGNYGTGNYAKKNMAYKAFAKKTINGKTYYRLGTDKQWIPAQYVEVR